jgi:hypothetical protein
MISMKRQIQLKLFITKMKNYIHVFAINYCFRLLLTEDFKILMLNITKLTFYRSFFRPVIFPVTPLLRSCYCLLIDKFNFIAKNKSSISINEL